MSITINAKGTSVPFFTIGKGGTTLYPSATDPSLSYTMQNGDVWINSSSNSLQVWSSTDTDWVAPALADFTFLQNELSVQPGLDLILSTDSTHKIILGTNSVILGNDADATGEFGFAQGAGALSTLYGQRSYANGSFSHPGDAQFSTFVLRAETTDDTPTELFLDGTAGTEQLVISANSVVTFSITVAARQLSDSGIGAGYSFTGVAIKDSTNASTAFIGTPSKTVIGETIEGWDIELLVDTTSGCLRLVVTGTDSNVIHWVATVQTTEVAN